MPRKWSRQVLLLGAIVAAAAAFIVITGSTPAQIQYTTHLQRAEEKVRERQNATLRKFDVGSYERFDWSQEEGVIVFSDGGTPKVVADVQFVGSYSDNTKTWLWAWVNDSVDDSLRVQAFGREQGLERLTTAKWPATEADGWEMATFQASLTGADMMYRTPFSQGKTYLTLKNVRQARPGERFSFVPSEPAASRPPDCTVRDGTRARSGRLIQQWSHAGDELSICSYGTTPEEIAAQTWEGEEFFVVLRRQETKTVLLDFSALHTARYSAALPGFVFTELTVAAEDRPWTNRLPLVRHDIRLGATPPMRSSFVFEGRPFERKKFEAMIRDLHAEGLSGEQRERMLFRIRDVAVSRPVEALQLLEQPRERPWADGATGETLSMVIREIELARDLPRGTAQ